MKSRQTNPSYPLTPLSLSSRTRSGIQDSKGRGAILEALLPNPMDIKARPLSFSILKLRFRILIPSLCLKADSGSNGDRLEQIYRELRIPRAHVVPIRRDCHRANRVDFRNQCHPSSESSMKSVLFSQYMESLPPALSPRDREMPSSHRHRNASSASSSRNAPSQRKGIPRAPSPPPLAKSAPHRYQDRS